MRSFRQLAVLVLPLLAGVACEEPASPTEKTESRLSGLYANANEAFQELLNALPEESLHVALNSLTHFRDGIFESDRDGVERVHQDNPPLATKLIVAAVQDLRKRQQPAPTNGTGQSTPSQGTSQTPAQSSNTPASSASVPVSVPTSGKGQSSAAPSNVVSQPTASVVVPVTRTNSQGKTEVATETKPAVLVTQTDNAGKTVVITSAAPTSGQVFTRTDSRGSTFLTTYTPDGGKVSSVLLITTTDANGNPAVITSYTFIDPAGATATDKNGNPTGSTAKPGLQSGAAVRNRGVDAVMVGGVLGGALAFFV